MKKIAPSLLILLFLVNLVPADASNQVCWKQDYFTREEVPRTHSVIKWGILKQILTQLHKANTLSQNGKTIAYIDPFAGFGLEKITIGDKEWRHVYEGSYLTAYRTLAFNEGYTVKLALNFGELGNHEFFEQLHNARCLLEYGSMTNNGKKSIPFSSNYIMFTERQNGKLRWREMAGLPFIGDKTLTRIIYIDPYNSLMGKSTHINQLLTNLNTMHEGTGNIILIVNTLVLGNNNWVRVRKNDKRLPTKRIGEIKRRERRKITRVLLDIYDTLRKGKNFKKQLKARNISMANGAYALMRYKGNCQFLTTIWGINVDISNVNFERLGFPQTWSSAVEGTRLIFIRHTPKNRDHCGIEYFDEGR